MTYLYKFSDSGIEKEDGVILTPDCPVIKLEKALTFHDLEIKRDKEGCSQMKAVLSECEKLDHDGDIIKQGAFDESIKNLDFLKMLRMHERKDIIGRWTDLKMDGNLLVADGILYDGEKDGYEMARMTRKLIDTGDMKAVSIGFRLIKWEVVNDKEADRFMGYDIQKLELMEASIVDKPANDSAKVSEIKAKLMKSVHELDIPKVSPEDEYLIKLFAN